MRFCWGQTLIAFSSISLNTGRKWPCCLNASTACLTLFRRCSYDRLNQKGSPEPQYMVGIYEMFVGQPVGGLQRANLGFHHSASLERMKLQVDDELDLGFLWHLGCFCAAIQVGLTSSQTPGQDSRPRKGHLETSHSARLNRSCAVWSRSLEIRVKKTLCPHGWPRPQSWPPAIGKNENVLV